ncbi:MAG: DNA primase [Candidatus Shikimatogenerans bostrichidophilus]|nr:MAG: DNA primase [Candidatus Shikimatogenerans bostrichidophilus]
MNYNTIKKIINNLKIENIINNYVKLKKNGNNYIGFSPFNKENNPSFLVSPTKKIWRDFSYGVGGNLIKFFMKFFNFNFKEAIDYLIKKHVNKNLVIDNLNYKKENNDKYKIYKILKYSCNFFKKQLKKNKNIKKYLTNRNITEKTINIFNIGYAPKYYNLINKLKKFNLNNFYIKNTGLFTIKNKIFNLFIYRIMFPIKNINGYVIGFGGRSLNDNYNKYINSYNNIIYNKSQILYGIYEAREHIIKNNFCYLVEGYIDVLSLYSYNIKNVISTLGTSINQYQIDLIKKYTNKIILLYDGDKPGILASIKNINLFLINNINIRFFIFPKKQDPNTFLIKKKNKIKNFNLFFKKKSLNFFDFKIKIFNSILKDPYKKCILIKKILNNINNINDYILKKIFIQKLELFFKIKINNTLPYNNNMINNKIDNNYNYIIKYNKINDINNIILNFKKYFNLFFIKYKKLINYKIIILFFNKKYLLNIKKILSFFLKKIKKNKIFPYKKKLFTIKKSNLLKKIKYLSKKKITTKIIINNLKEKFIRYKYYYIIKKIDNFKKKLNKLKNNFKKKIKILNNIFNLNKKKQKIYNKIYNL